MKIQVLTMSLGALFIGNAMACDTAANAWRDCEWFGTAPSCGWTNNEIGDTVDGWTLADWTKDKSSTAFCYKEQNQGSYGNCCGEYGSGCLSGYKRLWCKG
ncbi:hypothetical protein BDV25DRAFT_135519 [Aspergillus avenaceus]|uniref:Uncharacterized protein n=1 Tax=Aspergillus avenaceus TaxID=36643 RepID=A0A5N6U8D9_ASPAV|nr:hypothetical protein BDV25DRAFT_135519 [Aspergillus avenaceus]